MSEKEFREQLINDYADQNRLIKDEDLRKLNRLSPEERYRRDSRFSVLVDMIHSLIRGAEYTTTEIREASILAQIKYETYSCRQRTMFYPGEKR